jgi:hypothetical protein
VDGLHNIETVSIRGFFTRDTTQPQIVYSCSFTEERDRSTFFKPVKQAESDFRNDAGDTGYDKSRPSAKASTRNSVRGTPFSPQEDELITLLTFMGQPEQRHVDVFKMANAKEPSCHTRDIYCREPGQSSLYIDPFELKNFSALRTSLVHVDIRNKLSVELIQHQEGTLYVVIDSSNWQICVLFHELGDRGQPC